MSKISIDEKQLSDIKNVITSNDDKEKEELLKKFNRKITENPTKYGLLITKWNGFIKYIFSPKTPIKNKIYIMGGLAYLIAPINIPGPIDELIVLPVLINFITKEIDRMESGYYDNPENLKKSEQEEKPISFDTETSYNTNEIKNKTENNVNNLNVTYNPFETGTQY